MVLFKSVQSWKPLYEERTSEMLYVVSSAHSFLVSASSMAKNANEVQNL